MLISSPHFLGLLRETVSDQVRKHILGSLDKDYTQMAPRDLTERLSDFLPE